MNIALKKITSDGIVDRNTVLRVRLKECEKELVINYNNINNFIKAVRQIFSNTPFSTKNKIKLKKDLQLIADITTIDCCMKYNNLLESDFSHAIEEMIHTDIKHAISFLDGKENPTLDDLYMQITTDSNKILPTLHKKWKKEDDEMGKNKFEKMMRGAANLESELDFPE